MVSVAHETGQGITSHFPAQVVRPNAKRLDIDNGVLIRCFDSSPEVILPDSVTVIAWGAFSGCTNLSRVVLPESLREIGPMGFKDCVGLTSIVIPSSLESIGFDAFAGCTGLRRVEVGSLEKWFSISFGGYAAPPCYLGANLVVGGEVLTDLRFEGLGSRVPDDAFSGCGGLRTVRLGAEVREIGTEAFQSCKDLTDVYLPEGLIVVGRGAFFGCKGVRVHFPGTELPYGFNPDDELILCAPKLAFSSLDTKRVSCLSAAEGWVFMASRDHSLHVEEDCARFIRHYAAPIVRALGYDPRVLRWLADNDLLPHEQALDLALACADRGNIEGEAICLTAAGRHAGAGLRI